MTDQPTEADTRQLATWLVAEYIEGPGMSPERLVENIKVRLDEVAAAARAEGARKLERMVRALVTVPREKQSPAIEDIIISLDVELNGGEEGPGLRASLPAEGEALDG